MPLPKCVRVLEDDTQSREALEADGWRYVETLVEMKRTADAMGRHKDVRVVENDAERRAVAALAIKLLGPNRFVADGFFEEAEIGRRAWVMNFGGEILVAGDPKLPDGFLLRDGNQLSLMAGPDFGVMLCSTFVAHAYADGFDEVFLGTQEHNMPAMSLYRKLGFRTYRRRVTYHKDAS